MQSFYQYHDFAIIVMLALSTKAYEYNKSIPEARYAEHGMLF
jgi:hypothetical protein